MARGSHFPLLAGLVNTWGARVKVAVLRTARTQSQLWVHSCSPARGETTLSEASPVSGMCILTLPEPNGAVIVLC